MKITSASWLGVEETFFLLIMSKCKHFSALTASWLDVTCNAKRTTNEFCNEDKDKPAPF